jgi:hypothetical protein
LDWKVLQFIDEIRTRNSSFWFRKWKQIINKIPKKHLERENNAHLVRANKEKRIDEAAGVRRQSLTKTSKKIRNGR